jgi:hypothetical protein
MTASTRLSGIPRVPMTSLLGFHGVGVPGCRDVWGLIGTRAESTASERRSTATLLEEG